MTWPQVDLPMWLADLPEGEARLALRRSLSEWIRSEALVRLAGVWDGAAPLDESDAELFAWFDAFSATHWDYRAGKERNLAAKPQLTPSQEQAALAGADALGLVEPRAPRRATYDTVLILGGLLRACITRPAYAAVLSHRGLRIDEIVALGGFRALAGDELGLASHLNVNADNEFDAMIHGVNNAFVPAKAPEIERSSAEGACNADWAVATFPQQSPALCVIAAPSSDPDNRRANSVDTYRWWAERKSEGVVGHNILLITSAIYVPYQEAGAILSLGMPFGSTVETVGVPSAVADLGTYTQQFEASNYLQEIRSAIRGYRQLLQHL